ncbi:MAG: AMP-binding protein [Actinomycetota bacterium]
MNHRPTGISDLVRRNAAADPRQPALVDGSSGLTYRELDAHATRAASALRAAGYPSGERIALQVGNSTDFVVLYLGALRAGLIVVPANPGHSVPELRHLLSDSGATLLVTGSVAAIEAAAELPVREVLVAATQAPDGMRTVAELIAGATDGPDPHADRTGDQIAVLLYTSGTTRRPRGAMLSARALLANLEQVAAVEPSIIGSDDVVFVPLPMFHAFGLNLGLGAVLYAGATVVLADRFDVAQTLATMARESVTIVIGAPSMFAAWGNRPGLASAFAGVRLAVSGSAPLPSSLVATYAKAGIALHEGYGLTEAAPVVTLNVTQPKAGSVGRPLPGVEVLLLDADGDPVDDEDKDPGQLVLRGPNLFSGYWPDGAGGPDADGWFATGDIAVADEDGDLFLVGRSTDLVLVNGFNVYPAEVEAVLAAEPGVAEVAAVGVDDEQTGQAVVAYVVPSPGATLDPAAILASAARSLARFKLPREIAIVPELPRTVTGKVMKWRLREPGGAGAGR